MTTRTHQTTPNRLRLAALTGLALVSCSVLPSLIIADSDADGTAAPRVSDGAAVAPPPGQQTTDTTEHVFADTVQPFLEAYCFNCHDDLIQKGGVDLSTLDPAAMAQDAPLWRIVKEQVAHRTMPPPNKKQPEEDARIAVADWINAELTAAFAGMPQRGGPALSRRLTGPEFDRSIRDLTGIDEHFSKQFPADGGGGEGFTNNASTLFMSPLLISKVLDTSTRIADQAQVSWHEGIRFGGAKAGDTPSFNEHYKKTLRDRGVFQKDTDRLEQYLVLLWQYGQAKRKDRKLSVADFAQQQSADPVFLERLQAMMRVSRAPRGSDKSVVEFFRAWSQSNRIRLKKGEEDQALEQAREVASACVTLVNQNPASFTAYFTDGDTKQKLLDANDTKALESLVFFCSVDETLAGLSGDDRRQFDGLWLASQADSDDRGVQRKAAVFVGNMLGDFAQRAWRRPIEDNEQSDFARQYLDLTTKENKSFEEAARIMIRSVLISPHFLFRFELQPKPGEQAEVTPYEMASRLSYFLWGSMPDQTLIDLAEQGKLQDEAVLREQVQRMLQDDRSEALAESFFGEWIGYVDLLTQDGPDSGIFPEWKPELAEAMVEQAKHTMTYMVREDRPYTDLIEADYLFVNGQLASFLGISGVHGEHWERVSGKNQSRFGVTGLPAVHVITSHANRTSPVKRGDWLISTLLGTPTPPPPPNVGELEEQEATKSAASLREQLEIHRDNASCASCHNRIDPLGFPLEYFDALGRARPGEIDLKGELPNGTVFEGPDGLRDVLISRQELLRRQLVVKTLGYALGRGVRLEDEPVVQQIEKKLEKDPRLSVLFTEVVLSPAFRTKTNAARQE